MVFGIRLLPQMGGAMARVSKAIDDQFVDIPNLQNDYSAESSASEQGRRPVPGISLGPGT
jgi:hypothetical protein